ncbi:hypothetical protein Cni_G11719 [Canna indica]|uniref:Methyltransferase type 12 domain-containing protein n=1 Tax=Canna indica TaxID=4628 RepID=A0AAQ3Q9T1_9LILI|nr:hypothetical protein Cni_G11719 [Canna indica]
MPPAPLLLHRHLHCCLLLSPRLGFGGGNGRPSFLCRFSSTHLSPRADYQKYERNPTKYWDDFYKRHQDKFFKDRHYLEKDWGRYFSECSSSDSKEASADPKVLLEVGCGVGNTLFPLLSAFPNVVVHACDFSPHAIALIKENGAFLSHRLNAFVCDVTKDDLSKIISPSSVDVITMFLPRICLQCYKMLELFLNQMAMCFLGIMHLGTLLRSNLQRKVR